MSSDKFPARCPEDGAHLLACPIPHTDDMSSGFVHGLHSLVLGGEHETLIYIPTSYDGIHPSPLVLMLHGAGSNAGRGINYLQALADQAGLILLSPTSQGVTWDVIRGSYGADVQCIDRMLGHVFERYSVDVSRLAIGGFSDGASYALSLGVTNGDLFTHLLAFSPGFMAPTAGRAGPQSPRIFISHGTDDKVLPINVCSRKIVPRLEQTGYNVTYREFDGPHTIPPAVSREAISWLLSPS